MIKTTFGILVIFPCRFCPVLHHAHTTHHVLYDCLAPCDLCIDGSLTLNNQSTCVWSVDDGKIPFSVSLGDNHTRYTSSLRLRWYWPWSEALTGYLDRGACPNHCRFPGLIGPPYTRVRHVAFGSRHKINTNTVFITYKSALVVSNIGSQTAWSVEQHGVVLASDIAVSTSPLLPC